MVLEVSRRSSALASAVVGVAGAAAALVQHIQLQVERGEAALTAAAAAAGSGVGSGGGGSCLAGVMAIGEQGGLLFFWGQGRGMGHYSFRHVALCCSFGHI